MRAKSALINRNVDGATDEEMEISNRATRWSSTSSSQTIDKNRRSQIPASELYAVILCIYSRNVDIYWIRWSLTRGDETIRKDKELKLTDVEYFMWSFMLLCLWYYTILLYTWLDFF